MRFVEPAEAYSTCSMNSIFNIITNILQNGIDVWKEVIKSKNGGAGTGTNYLLTTCPSSTRPVIPSDVVMEIVSYMSVEDVLRYKSLSKSWLDMLSSPYFVNLHMSRSPTLILATINQEAELDDVLPDDIDSENYNMIASCNGLLAIRDEEDGFYYILNPALRRRIRLPQPPGRWKSMQLYHVPSTNQYKLVCAHVHDAEVYLNLSMLTLGEIDWRLLPNCWATDCCLSRDAPHLYRCEAMTTLLWTENEDPSYLPPNKIINVSDVGDKILSLDVESEVLMEVELPRECKKLFGKPYLLSEFSEGWEGHLAIIFHDDDFITAFVLEDYRNKKWVRKTVTHNRLLHKDEEALEIKQVIGHYHWVTDDRGWIWFQDDEDRLNAYHMKTRKGVSYKFDNYGSLLRVCPFKNTLVMCEGM